jgi:fucose 4-O-acetylase-like acetyltransferase
MLNCTSKWEKSGLNIGYGKRYPQIDILYTIGTLLVVLGHSHSSDWSTFSSTFFNNIIVFVYTFHMPLFFFIAGFLLENSNSLKSEGYWKWVGNKALKLLIPYIVLTIVFFVPKFYLEQRTIEGIGREFIESIFVPRLNIWGHFWFIPVLLLVYMIFGAIKKLETDNNKVVLLVMTFIVSIAIYFIPFGTQWFGLDDVKKMSVFFVVGIIVNYILRQRPIYISHFIRIIFIAISIALSIYFTKCFYNSKIVMLFVALLMIFVSWNLALLLGNNKISTWISKHNFTIYIYSWPFQALVMMICERLNLKWYIMSIAMFLVGLGVPIIIALLYEKFKKVNNKFFDLLLGVK